MRRATFRIYPSLLAFLILMACAGAPCFAQEDPFIAEVSLLNRQDDCLPLNNGAQSACGVNLDVHANDNQGSNAMELSFGMVLASKANGTGQTPSGAPRGYAGQNSGGGTILTGPRTPAWINSGGAFILAGGAQWLPEPVSVSDGSQFLDPTRGLPQPFPAEPSSPRWGPAGVEPRPSFSAIPGGPDASNPAVLEPGVYYSVETASAGGVVANGQPVRLGPGYFHLVPASNQTFADFVFIGGLLAPGGAVHMKVSPGIYFFAGAQESSGKPGDLLRLSNNSTLTDGQPPFCPNQFLAPGEILVFSDARSARIQQLAAAVDQKANHQLSNLLAGATGFAPLRHGIAGIQTTGNGHIGINLRGLGAEPPIELFGQRAVVFWQDRNNSVVDYTDEDGTGDGMIYCGNFAPGCSNTGEPRMDENQNPLPPEPPADRLNSSFSGGESTEFVLPSNPDVHICGVSYQPRGAFMSVVGSGGSISLLQVISGAMSIRRNASIKLGLFAN